MQDIQVNLISYNIEYILQKNYYLLFMWIQT